MISHPIRVVLLLLAFIWSSVAARSQEPSEYQVEAAFLYYFAKFVVWPAEAFPQQNSPITIGILGEDPFGDALETTVHNKTIDNHPFRIVHLDMKSLPEASRCQILFICPSEKRRLSEILAAVKNSSVLTVSKMDKFIQSGGMINFWLEDKKVRFEINDEPARRAGLKISAKLLNLSRHKENP
jgi:hypothetical protein